MNGQDVIDFRRRRNLSRKALAQAVGLTEGVVWRIENKSTIHDAELAALLRIGVEELNEDPPTLDVPKPIPQVVPAAPTPEPVVVDNGHLEPRPTIEVGDVDFPSMTKQVERSFEHYVSNSELKTFKRCRRKWWLSWYRGLRQRDESPIGVRQIGNRLHRALQQHYVPGGPKTTTQLLDALEREIMSDRSILGETTSWEVRERFEKEADLERIMLEGYIQWLAETGADSELEVISAEQYVEAELTEFGNVAIIGKIDVRVRRNIDGVHLFIDHKSVGDLRTPILTVAMDEQMLHYHLLESMTNDTRSDGALYNMLRRVKRTGTAKPPFYERVEVRHNDIELANYRRRVVSEVQDILTLRDELDTWPDAATHIAYPNPTRDCTWDCPFLAVCPMFDDGSRAEDLLTEYFVQVDPLDYYIREILKENEEE